MILSWRDLSFLFGNILHDAGFVVIMSIEIANDAFVEHGSRRCTAQIWGTSLKRVGAVLKRVEIQIVLWCMFLFLYSWPLLTTMGQGKPYILYIYYYAVLGIHVTVMFMLKRGLTDSTSESAWESRVE